MISIIYVSSATRLLPESELVELLKTCRSKNEPLKITGMLLYQGGNFMQVIEGPEAAVTALYEKIQRDPRHSGVYQLARKAIEKREFADWSMGFQNVDELPAEARAGFSEFLKDKFTAEVFRKEPGRAHRMLLMFRSNMR